MSKCGYLWGQVANQPYCSNCAGLSSYGAYCNIADYTLSNNTLANFPIFSGAYLAFTIPSSSSQINLVYSSNVVNIEVFIQFKTFSEESAGIINYVISPSSRADYMINSTT